MEETREMVAPETTGEAAQLIVIKQLPIIQEQLYMIKSQVEAVVAEALAMEVTEDTVVAIKDKPELPCCRQKSGLQWSQTSNHALCGSSLH